jgi:XTP/dITP diphosphohydrolase
MSPLVIATHNEGKVREFRELLAAAGTCVISAATLGLPEPEETGASFSENALIKSQSAAALSGHYSLGDDSGLCVVGLDGAPGIYSARWLGPSKDYNAAFARIENELLAKQVTPEGAAAYFMCVLALTTPDGTSQTFEGRIDGTLTFPARGKGGFGYDPLFIPAGFTQTFGELEPGIKHTISARARAFAAFANYFTTQTQKVAS